MKTPGRILIILIAFAIVMGITYVAVNTMTASTSLSAPAFERDGERFQPPTGEHPDFDGGRETGAGLIFGLIKNIVIIAIFVAVITIPKSLRKRKVIPKTAG